MGHMVTLQLFEEMPVCVFKVAATFYILTNSV